jgi:hypothetical protein
VFDDDWGIDMLEFVERNKHRLFYYRVVLAILGWILLCMAGIALGLVIKDSLQMGGRVDLGGTFGTFKRSYTHYFNIGLLSIGLAQLVRYLAEDRMGLLLRYGDKIFYLYAIVSVWQEIGLVWLVASGKMGGGPSAQMDYFLFSLPVSLIYRITEVLVLVGLGILLKKVVISKAGSELNPEQEAAK